MDVVEARRILDERLAQFRPLPYADLVAKVNSVVTEEVAHPGHRPWQLEFQFFWDDEPDGNVRVIGSIDDGGLRAFMPVTDSFIKSPGEGFVDE